MEARSLGAAECTPEDLTLAGLSKTSGSRLLQRSTLEVAVGIWSLAKPRLK
jgi:hypothetical protein